MKKVIDYRVQYRINGKEWIDTNYFKNLLYLDEKECEDWESRTEDFDKAIEWASHDDFMGTLKVGKTLFTKEPKLEYLLNNERSWLDNANCSCVRKKFKSLEIRVVHENTNYTIDTLKTNLSADSFCEYLKDRGVERIIL